jgi:CrcB protein
MTNYLLVALGGAVGSVARYGIGRLMIGPVERTLFPWHTLAVNLIGCLLIGYLNGLIDDRIIRPEYRLLLVVGLLGGFTTFSSFGWETMVLIKDGHAGRAIAYVLASNVIGVLLVLAGWRLSVLHR